MADNVAITAGAGTTLASDDVGGVQYPRVKISIGADGTAADWPVGSGNQSAVPRVTLATDSPGIITTGTAGTPSAVVLSVQGVASGTVLPISFPSDQAASVAATFTPAASSHTALDVNGGAQTWAAMGLSGRPIMITGASLEIDGGTAEATAWRVYLYNVTPPSATADDGAWDLPSGDRASFLGYIDLGTAVDLGSTQWVEVQGINKQVKLAGTALFGYLVNITTLTPAAVAHIVTLHAVQL
jgi:hypothetical protein